MDLSPRSLYVHVPFCERKCPYCAFNSRRPRGDDEVERYVEALIQEIGLLSAGTALPLETIYVGGGTPTALTPEQLGRVLTKVREVAVLEQLREWTVEANPGTVEERHVEVLSSAGVDRVSMGVQSMNPGRLERLGRIHGPEEVTKTVGVLRKGGIENLNLDLIYGQPGQTLTDWEEDLRAVIALGPEHLSLYALQYEEGTSYGKALEEGRVKLLPEETVLDMFDLACQITRNAGYRRYEISNFARPGRESRHNLMYWRNLPYFGVGAGAWACVDGMRLRNETDIGRYSASILEQGGAVVERDPLGPSETYVESLSAGLRMAEGVDLRMLAERTGIDGRDIHGDHIAEIVAAGLASYADPRLILTERGLWVLDTVMGPFLELPTDVSAAP